MGALVEGVDRDRLMHDDALPEWTLQALEANGALVFRDLNLDDEAQVAFSRKLGTVEKLGRGKNPEIFLVTLDPTRNPAAAYLKGTFDWHIDGCTDYVPIMATMLSAHTVAESGGETEFASSYQAYEDLSDQEKARCESVRVVHTIEASQRLQNPDPSAETLKMMRQRPAKEHPLVWTHRSGRKSLVLGATTDHVVGMPARRAGPPRRAARPGHHSRAGLPPPMEDRRRGGLGQPRRAPPRPALRPGLAPGHAPHDLCR